MSKSKLTMFAAVLVILGLVLTGCSDVVGPGNVINVPNIMNGEFTFDFDSYGGTDEGYWDGETFIGPVGHPDVLYYQDKPFMYVWVEGDEYAGWFDKDGNEVDPEDFDGICEENGPYIIVTFDVNVPIEGWMTLDGSTELPEGRLVDLGDGIGYIVTQEYVPAIPAVTDFRTVTTPRTALSRMEFWPPMGHWPGDNVEQTVELDFGDGFVETITYTIVSGFNVDWDNWEITKGDGWKAFINDQWKNLVHQPWGWYRGIIIDFPKDLDIQAFYHFSNAWPAFVQANFDFGNPKLNAWLNGMINIWLNNNLNTDFVPFAPEAEEWTVINKNQIWIPLILWREQLLTDYFHYIAFYAGKTVVLEAEIPEIPEVKVDIKWGVIGTKPGTDTCQKFLEVEWLEGREPDDQVRRFLQFDSRERAPEVFKDIEFWHDKKLQGVIFIDYLVEDDQLLLYFDEFDAFKSYVGLLNIGKLYIDLEYTINSEEPVTIEKAFVVSSNKGSIDITPDEIRLDFPGGIILFTASYRFVIEK